MAGGWGEVARTLGPPVIAGVGAYAGVTAQNKANREEAEKNRGFQERMRNTQWQAAVADMEAAGLNPALAYQQGPNSAPGGSMAQQADALGPAISSSMQMKRMMADLQNIKANTKKLNAEAGTAAEIEGRERARNQIYGLERTQSGALRVNIGSDGYANLRKEIEAGIKRTEAQARREGLTGDVMQPLADLSQRFGEILPVLGLLSQMSPGGMLKGGRNMLKKRSPVGPVSKSMRRLGGR